MIDQRKQSPQTGLSSVLKMLGAMTAIRDTYLVEQSLLRTLDPMLGAMKTCLYRIDDNGGILRSLNHSRTVVAEGGGTHRVEERVQEVTNDGKMPEEIQDLFANVRRLGKPCSRKFGNDLLICYPLRGGGVLRGYFVFQRDHATTSVEDAIINGTLDVFSNYYELLDTSQRDQLTGLFNRYSLEINLERLWDLLLVQMRDKALDHGVSQRTETPHTYWIGVLDVDHFKSINDNYGHIIGDEVLIMISRLLEKSFRKSDLLYRYGGEEFIAIITANDLEFAFKAFNRARSVIEEFVFPQVGRITMSIGFSGADSSVLPQEVISRADSSLYAAKNAGRNRVCHYDTLVAQGVLKEVESGSIDLF